LSEVAKIRAEIETEMDLFEDKFKEAMCSQVSLLNRITFYIATRKGKQMRPMFVFLVAKLLAENNQVNERTYRGASIIELIHPLLWFMTILLMILQSVEDFFQSTPFGKIKSRYWLEITFSQKDCYSL